MGYYEKRQEELITDLNLILMDLAFTDKPDAVLSYRSERLLGQLASKIGLVLINGADSTITYAVSPCPQDLVITNGNLDPYSELSLRSSKPRYVCDRNGVKSRTLFIGEPDAFVSILGLGTSLLKGGEIKHS